MNLKTPLALGLLQAASFAARRGEEGGDIGTQIINGFTAIGSGGIGLIIAVVVVFIAAVAVGYFFGSR